MEQYLAWSMGQGRKMSAGRWILQGLLAIRLIAGGVFVAFTRPQFAPVCVARTSLMDVSILVLALDIVIIGFLIVQTLSQGMVREIGKTRGSTRTVQSKALVLTIAGFSAWTAVGPVWKAVPNEQILNRGLDQRAYAARYFEYIAYTENRSTGHWPTLDHW